MLLVQLSLPRPTGREQHREVSHVISLDFNQIGVWWRHCSASPGGEVPQPSCGGKERSLAHSSQGLYRILVKLTSHSNEMLKASISSWNTTANCVQFEPSPTPPTHVSANLSGYTGFVRREYHIGVPSFSNTLKRPFSGQPLAIN